MGIGFLCRQPNGKLCRYSHIVEGFTHINFTEEEYLNGDINENMSYESRLDTIENYIHHIKQAIQLLSLNNYSKKQLRKELIAIGFPEKIAIHISTKLYKFKSYDIDCKICFCTWCSNNCEYPCKSCKFDDEFKSILDCKEFK